MGGRRREKHAMAGLNLEQLASREASDAVAEVGEASRRRRHAELDRGQRKREEAEEDVDQVGARVGEQHAIARPVDGEVNLDGIHGCSADYSYY